MANQITFSENNVKKNAFDFPKVKLAINERARLTVVESPYMEYVHQIEKPILDAQNKVVMITKEKKDGTEYTTPKLTFVSNPICLGNPDVLSEDGIDPENCPACAKAAEGQKSLIPKRRFAVHVIRTNTVPGGFKPASPWGGQLLIWAFADTIFNKLVEIQNNFGLETHDVFLGPCTDANFQKAELAVGPDTVVSEENRKAYFAKENQAPDPTVFTGNRKNRKLIEADLALVDEVWAKANGEDVGATVTSTEALNSGISALLADEAPAADAPKPATDLSDLTAGVGKKDEEGWHVAAEDLASAQQVAAEKKSESSPAGELDIDALLAGA